MFVPETQLDAHERSDDETSIDEVPATRFPGVPVTQSGSDGFDALDDLSMFHGRAPLVRSCRTLAGRTVRRRPSGPLMDL